jgi:hypothetical protein
MDYFQVTSTIVTYLIITCQFDSTLSFVNSEVDQE